MGSDGHTPGNWNWWTSNSWRRLKSDLGGGKTANVLEPTKHPRDGHPDLIVSEADMALIAAAPEMYEALSDILRDFEDVELEASPELAREFLIEIVERHTDVARAALLKASTSIGEG